MDPVTALGVVSAAFSIVTFGKDLIKGGILIYDSAQIDHVGARSREAVVNEMQRFSSALILPGGDSAQASDQGLYRLAADCHTLSSELVNMVMKLKPKDPNSKFQNLRAAIKTSLHEKTLQELEDRLDSCRSQLHLELTHRTGDRTNALLASLNNASRDVSLKAQQIQSTLHTLRDGVKVSSLSPEAEQQFKQLIGFHEKALERIVQRRILNSLYFPDMHRRYVAVESAHEGTFKWIINNPMRSQNNIQGTETPEEVDVLYSNRHQAKIREAMGKFWAWIRADGGMLHISGKLGSGKSTLMKLFVDSEEVRASLKEWAGSRTLVLANFFFWKPGTDLQKSISGLLRSLLYDVLKSCPSLISRVLPEIWVRQYRELEVIWQEDSQPCINEEAVRHAIQELFHNNDIQRDYCFCFFIDGLDEYEATPRYDHKFMVDTIKQWHGQAPRSIKICLSSREENVFMNAFDDESRIRIHEVTRADIERYAEHQLSHISRHDSELLVREITSKAHGIFLWATLVVRAVREQIEDGVELDNLLRHIDSLPRELHDLFENLLGLIGSDNQGTGYKVLAMLSLANKYDFELTLETLPFLEHYERYDIESLLKLNKPDEPDEIDQRVGIYRKPAGDEQHLDRPVKARLATARRKLHSWCRGLVQDADNILEFTHRSVPEFLQHPHRRKTVEKFLTDFKPASALVHISLYERLSRDPFHWDYTLDIAAACFRDGDLGLMGVVDYLQDWLEDLQKPLPAQSPEVALDLVTGAAVSGRPFVYPIARWLGTKEPGVTYPIEKVNIRSLTLLALLENNSQYVLAQLRRNPRLTDHPNKIGLILQTAVEYDLYPVYPAHADVTKTSFPVVDWLFSEGLLHPHLPYDLTSYSRYYGYKVPTDYQQTIWEAIIQVALRFNAFSIGNGINNRKFSRLLGRFLEHGADARYNFTITAINGSPGYHDYDVKLRCGQSVEYLGMIISYYLPTEYTNPSPYQEVQLDLLERVRRNEEVTMTLRLFAEGFFPGEDRLLWLIDRNLAYSQGLISRAVWTLTGPREPKEGMDEDARAHPVSSGAKLWLKLCEANIRVTAPVIGSSMAAVVLGVWWFRWRTP